MYDAICAMPSEHPEFIGPLSEAATEAYPCAVDINGSFRKEGKSITSTTRSLPVDDAASVLVLDDVYATGGSFAEFWKLLQARRLSSESGE